MFASFDYEYVSYEELYEAYVDCRKHKWKTANAASFQVNLPYNLYKLWYDINNGTYTIGKSIAFIVEKPVKREVFAADFRDRIVHHLVIKRIINAFESEMINNSFSCRVGKGTLYGVKTLYNEIKLISENYTKDSYVLKGDFQSFFMTINKNILYDKVDKLIRDAVYPHSDKDYKFTSNLCKLIIDNCPQKNCIRKHDISKWRGLPKEKSLFNTPVTHGLPIGNLTSQIFANFLLNDFDKFIYNDLGFKYYGRYVDDFYILSNDKEKLINALPIINNKLSEIGIKLHPKKLYLQNIQKGVKFIGAIVKPNRIYILNRTIGNLKQMLKVINDKFSNSEMTSKDVNDFVCSFNSYFGFLRQYNTFNIRKKIIRSNLMNIFFNKCYFDKKLTKIIPFKEYSIFNKNISYNLAVSSRLISDFNFNYFPVLVKN